MSRAPNSLSSLPTSAEQWHQLQARSGRVVVDATGVGRPVLEMLRMQRCGARKILYSVEYLLRNRLLTVATDTPQTKTFARKLSLMERDFATNGREVLETSVSTAHDDLLFATAFACW